MLKKSAQASVENLSKPKYPWKCNNKPVSSGHYFDDWTWTQRHLSKKNCKKKGGGVMDESTILVRPLISSEVRFQFLYIISRGQQINVSKFLTSLWNVEELIDFLSILQEFIEIRVRVLVCLL